MNHCVQWDVPTSTVLIDGRRFPAVGLRCPDGLICGRFIPLESGALLHVSPSTVGPHVWSIPTARTCHAARHRPIDLAADYARRQLVPTRRPRWIWERDLIAELEALSSFAYREPVGPRCELLPLVEVGR